MSGLFWADCIAVRLQDTDLGGRVASKLRYRMDVIARTAWGQSSTFVKIVKRACQNLSRPDAGQASPVDCPVSSRLTGL